MFASRHCHKLNGPLWWKGIHFHTYFAIKENTVNLIKSQTSSETTMENIHKLIKIDLRRAAPDAFVRYLYIVLYDLKSKRRSAYPIGIHGIPFKPRRVDWHTTQCNKHTNMQDAIMVFACVCVCVYKFRLMFVLQKSSQPSTSPLKTHRLAIGI